MTLKICFFWNVYRLSSIRHNLHNLTCIPPFLMNNLTQLPEQNQNIAQHFILIYYGADEVDEDGVLLQQPP